MADAKPRKIQASSLYGRFDGIGCSGETHVFPVVCKNGSRCQCGKARYCDVCSRTDKHIHCPECGATTHVAEDCDMSD